MTFTTQQLLTGTTPAPLTHKCFTTEQNVAAVATRRSSSLMLEKQS